MDIGEHIAYLIGDSKRLVIPTYESYGDEISGLPFILLPHSQMGDFDNIFQWKGPETLLDDVSHPEYMTGVIGRQGPETGYLGTSEAAAWTPQTGWVGNLSHFEYDKWYQLLYHGQTSIDVTDIYGTQIGHVPLPVGAIPQNVLEQWIKDSIIKTSRLVPSKFKLHLTASKIFTAGEYTGNTNVTNRGIHLDTVDSSDIVSVTRYDGDIAYDCRQIPLHMRTKSRFGSGFIEECSETDPIYYVVDNFLVVEPNPEQTHLHAFDGFCTIDYISYPEVSATDLTMNGIPFDMQNIILISAASKCKQFQISNLEIPSSPILNPNFKVVQLDNPDTVDAIEKAQQLIDDYSGESFKDFLNDEDIDMAKTALTGAASELEIAKTQLAEQDKVASEYLSEYSQNISKFTQDISHYVQIYKKYNADFDALKGEYQELIYSLRGELPNKKQLKDTERKLETIKQVVQRN